MVENEKNYQLPPLVADKLMTLTRLIGSNESISDYRKIERQVKHSASLSQIQRNLRKAQREIVNFDHYDKPVAKADATKRADELTATLNAHPLVITYRNNLYEANEVLQWIMEDLQAGLDELMPKEDNKEIK